MITLQALSLHLEQLLHPEKFSDGCPNGVQVEGKGEIRQMMCAVSASLEAIQQAVALQADALLVHHGLLWNRDPLPICKTKRDKLKLLLSHGISLIAYHLPLDAHTELGNNWKAAKELGWQDLEPFGGIGVKGRFDPVSTQHFRSQIEEYYGHPAHVAFGGKELIGSAGLISGGAHREISQAADSNLDAYLTGSFDEPIWDIAFERKIHFFALGHYATEKIGIAALGQHIETFLRIPCPFIDFKNPF